jgi:hypothetical protein
VPGIPPRTAARHRAIFASLESRGGVRHASIKQWALELGFDMKTLRVEDLDFLVSVGFIGREVFEPVPFQGQKPTRWTLLHPWEEYVAQAPTLRKAWMARRRALRAIARQQKASAQQLIQAAKEPERVVSMAKELAADIPAKPTPVVWDDPAVGKIMGEVDDDFLLAWG